MMLTILIFVISFVTITRANVKNKLVFDYFNFKKAPSVVGFTCGAVEDNVSLLNDFNRRGIYAAFHRLANSTSIKLIVKNKYRKLGIFVDADCYKLTEIETMFSEACDHYIFDELYYWFIVSTDLDVESLTELIDDRGFGTSTDLVLAIDSNNYSFDLYDVYNPSKEYGGTINVTRLGTWNEVDGIEVGLRQTKIARRSNLHQIIFRTVFLKLKYKPANTSIDNYLQEYRNPVDEGQNRYGFIILKHLSDLYNFTMKSIEAHPLPPNDTFGAHAQTLADNLADFTGTPLLIAHHRMKFLKYLHQDWPFRTCFIFRNPQPKVIKLEEVLGPFATEIWKVTAFVMAINTIGLAMFLQFENSDSKLTKLSDSFCINVGLLCQQGTTESIVRLSTRTALLFVATFGYLITVYYSSTVVSTRLNEQVYKINDSLREFSKLNLRMASFYMSYFKLILSYSDSETRSFYHNTWSKIPETEWYMEADAGMRLVQQGGFAYHAHPETQYPIVNDLFSNNEICELMEVHLQQPRYTNFALKYNSTIVELARVGLVKIAEAGLRRRQIVRWFNRKPVCRSDVLSASRLSIYEFASHLILLLIGMVLAIFLGFMENLIYYNECWKAKLPIHSDFQYFYLKKKLFCK